MDNEAPSKETLSEEALSKEASGQETPGKEALSKETSSKETPGKEALSKETSSRETPSKEIPTKPTLSLAVDVLAGFSAIRAEFGVAGSMPAEVEEAAKTAEPTAVGRRDATNLVMVTLDPQRSTDLDQAFAFSLEPGANRNLELGEANIILHYAIADIGAFAPLGGVIETEAWKRGTTVYAPDESTPVYPRILCQDRASLLPDGPRPCILLEVVVTPDGLPTLRNVERATIASRAKLAYETTTKDDLAPEAVELAKRVTEAEDRRGAFRVELQEQEVVIDPAIEFGVAVRFVDRAESEDLNACVSLAANMAVANAMIERGIGLFRVMADPDAPELASLRRTARTLGIAWSLDETLRQVIPRLDPCNAKHIAFSISARRSGGGASYAVFPPLEVPLADQTANSGVALHKGKPWHAAMAASYAHATAPMRRLADRYVLELLLAEFSGDDVAKAALLPKFSALPAVMAAADSRAAKVNRACLDFAECVILSSRVGDTFEATVIEVSRDIAQFTINYSCVVARVRVPHAKPGRPEVSPGDELRVRLDAVDLADRRLSFTVVGYGVA